MEKITVSAALRRIAALKGDLSRLEIRRRGAITYQVASPPAWALVDLEAQMKMARKELIDLKVRLAVTNATATVEVPGEGARTLISCITEMQEVKGQLANDEVLMGFTKPAASFAEKERDYDEDGKLRWSETPMKCDLTSQVLDDRLTALRERFALLNAVVEAANHTVTV